MKGWRTAAALGLLAVGVVAAAQAPAVGVEKEVDGSYRDALAGITFRAPTGWTDSADGDTVVLRSPDSALTITITTETASDAETAARDLVADACRGFTACAADGPARSGQLGSLQSQSADGRAQSAQGEVLWRAELVSAKLPVLLLTRGAESAIFAHVADLAAFRLSVRDAPEEPRGPITNPRVIYDPEPSYTDAARDAGFQGSVTIDIVIGADGKVTDAHVVNPVGYGLDMKAVEAVNTWRFQPATQGGVPISTHARVQVTFRLGN